MDDLFSAVLTGLLAFMAVDYTLGRAKVKDPWRIVISIVFALFLVIVIGVLSLTDIVSLD